MRLSDETFLAVEANTEGRTDVDFEYSMRPAELVRYEVSWRLCISCCCWGQSNVSFKAERASMIVR